MSKIDLRLGDCLEVMKTIEDNSIDAIITDPPYGTTVCKWDSIIPFEAMWERLNKLIKSNSAIVLFGSEPFSSALRMSNIKNYKYDLVWNKNLCKNPGLAKIRPLPSFENIIIFGEGKITYNPQMEVGKAYTDIRKKSTKVHNGNEHKYGFSGNTVNVINKGTRYPKSVITIKNPNRKGQHPTQKPVALIEYLIKTYTKENETVLDFTMGSGSTGVACVNTNRDFIGIELDENYLKIAEKRINKAQIQTKLFKN